MKIALKILFVLTLLLVLTLGGFITYHLLLNRPSPNQPIALSDGSIATFVGVTVGTNHTQGTPTAKLLELIPGEIGRDLRRKFPKSVLVERTTSDPKMLVWMHRATDTNAVPTNPRSSRRAYVTAAGSPISGESEWISFSAPGPSGTFDPAQFDIWPRRASRLEFVIAEADAQYNWSEIGRFEFPNRKPVKVPSWRPESLPATRESELFNVTLTAFHAGIDNSRRGSAYRDGRQVRTVHPAKTNDAPGAFGMFRVESPQGTNEAWKLAKIWLSDATGNRMKAMSWSGGEDGTMRFSPVLWPDEDAWKLEMDLKRSRGYPTSDLITFSNIPLPNAGRTNVVSLTNNANGVTAVLEHIIRRPNFEGNSYSSGDLSEIHLEHSELTVDTVVDLVSAVVVDTGEILETAGSGWTDTYYEFNLKTIPTNATSLDLTYAIQKTHRVAFRVAPNWHFGTNTIEIEIEIESSTTR